MARTIYINTDNGSIESAPVAGLNRPSARVPLREIVAGTTETYNLYLVKSDGTYDSRSGSGAVSVNVAIGQRAQTATSGNFTVTDSSGTSAEISSTASAQAVEDVLNAMNSGTGAEGGLCDVQKLGSGIWLATWRENGARTVLTGASVDLTPESVVVPSISVTGDASSKCQQIIEVNRQPAIFQDTWSTITNGFSGTLDADVGRIVQALSAGQSIDFYFEVRIDDDAICSTPIRVLAPVGGAASVSSAAPYGGTLASDPANYPGFSVSAWESALSIEGFSAIAPDDKAVIRGNGTEWVKASNFRVDAGTAGSGTEMGNGLADGAYSVSEGSDTTASGSESHAEGSRTTASGTASHAEGFLTTASGTRSHAEGSGTTANGTASHAEGFLTTASGTGSHAEGSGTTANGTASHAEGLNTTASGDYSSATGRRGKAIHDGARVEADSQDADVSSTTTDQFTARFQNGYEFKGGLAAFEGGASFGDATTQATTRSNLGVTIYGQLYFSASAATTIAAAGTYVKLAGTTTSDSLNGITMPQNNRLQNNSGTTRVFQAMARTDIVDGSGNKAIAIKLAKNGILINPTESNGETTNNVAAHATINWIVSLADGEYVEIWATNNSDTSSITAQHGHLFLKAID
ncbi:tail fiber protein [Verrucomicrobia phage P8625]|uniref:tail fiber protein n=1 Tax=Verrucomicrobia phage P8625 TaxID=1636271 RepID=UPI0005FEB56C|nr:tail fiber protein [Verrucomicrobia phage P8625]AKA60273.1 tail fiber protein [Verrucomicrobia phage P8625]